jgi:hypothetical protein
MKTICAWCNQLIGVYNDPNSDEVSHGICKACREYFFPCNGEPPTINIFLNRLAAPVLVVDDNVKIVAANEKACALLERKLDEIVDNLGGYAIECVHARQEGGCGKTVHCKSCTIRITVGDTYSTGKSHYDVPAYLDSSLSKPDKPICILISAIKVADYVVVKIAAQQPAM